VLMRNRVLRSSMSTRSENARRLARRELDRLTTLLQDTVMRARMEPIGRLFERMARPVRDLAADLGREVEFEAHGGETELDRSLVETIADPILHLLRNAVDHGIESPSDRENAGKCAAARLTLAAHQTGSQVVIEVHDDGRGIDREALRERAREKGVARANDSAADPLEFMFEPGVSTVAEVSSVSGRGVGMDVVRTNVERLGGSIEVESQRGQGTTVRVRLPLTLAILPGVVVACAGQLFVLPQRHLCEMLRLESRDALDQAHDGPVHRHQGRLLPVVMLDEQLGLQSEVGEGLALAVLEAEGRRFGLVVDRIVDTQEIVVKPLGDPLRGLGIYGGATTLGDGQVVLILDPGRLAARAGVRAEQAILEDPEPQVPATSTERYLMVDRLDGQRMLIALDRLARLDQLEPSQVQHAAGRACISYRGGVLPLVDDGVPNKRAWIAVVRGNEGEFGVALAAIREVVNVSPTDTAMVGSEVVERFDVVAAERTMRVPDEARS